MMIWGWMHLRSVRVCLVGEESVQVRLIDGLTLGTFICAEAEGVNSAAGWLSMSMLVFCRMGNPSASDKRGGCIAQLIATNY